MESDSDLSNNHLLGLLAAKELKEFLPLVESLEVASGQTIFGINEELHHLYFPNTAIISLMHCMDDGYCIQIAIVGREGMLGVTELVGENASLTKALVIKGGSLSRISFSTLRKFFTCNEVYSSNTFQKITLFYAKMLFTQVSQNNACNSRHILEQRLSSWLLSVFDRIGMPVLSITQSRISQCLGVRRESITEAIVSLEKLNLITCHRGRVELTNRLGLEDLACECYLKTKINSVSMLKSLGAA